MSGTIYLLNENHLSQVNFFLNLVQIKKNKLIKEKNK